MQLFTAVQLLLGVVSTINAAPVTNRISSSSSSPVSARSLPAADLASFNPQWKLLESSVKSVKPALPQLRTNGKSTLGTVDAISYKQFRGQRSWNDGEAGPWGNKTAKNTNYYIDAPDTGKTVSYEWTIERAILAPDGVLRPMILVDGSFPGPTIEANWGDTISVTIHNKIKGPEEGTSIHWHGFLQKGTPYEDGVPGITQCPIAPGESFTYSFKADLYGTSWWHAHYSAQYSMGVYGAMIIHGPDQDGLDYDADLGPVLLADYYHQDYHALLGDVMGTDPKKITPKSDNNLINGKGIFNCNATATDTLGLSGINNNLCTPNAGLSKFNFISGQTYRLRLINAGVEGLQKFSIDDHDLVVVSYDFVPIQPYITRTVSLGVGQRADILVTANQNSSKAYWMRSAMTKCSLTNQPNGLAMVFYENADKALVPASQAVTDTSDPCTGDDLTTMVPYYPITPPNVPVQTKEVNINFVKNATGQYVWTMNNSTFRTDYNRPILQEIQNGTASSSLPSNWNIFDFGSSSSIRIIINNLSPIAHPMHIHGHNMYVLSSTNTISKNPVVVNPKNPTRRDVQMLPPNGQIVIQIDGDNPGVWPLHCHIAWHVSSGLYMNILERPQDLQTMAIPQTHCDMCQKWRNWSANNNINQIDSGLKVRRTPRIRRQI